MAATDRSMIPPTRLPREIGTEADLRRLMEFGRVLAPGMDMPRVVLRPDGLVVKRILDFRRWRRGSARARRFVRNARLLRERGITAPKVVTLLPCPAAGCQVVVYEAIAGESLREWHARGDASAVDELIRFLALLHDRGVYFRGAHLGNTLRCDDGTTALVDFQSASISSGPLAVSRRVKNIAHLLNARVDGAVIRAFGARAFVDAYTHDLVANPVDVKHLARKLSRLEW